MGNDHFEVTFKETRTKNELFCQFDEHHGVLLLDVVNSFTEEDFLKISELIDPYFLEHQELRGVIINSKKFPYWSNARNRAEYLNFAKNNHFKFQKAALNMGGFFTKIIARIAIGRIHPEVKIFKYNQIEKAQDWILK
jgi:hypothetical protein